MYKMWYQNTLYSIEHDFNMIIEEYGFWQKLPPKD